jgi:hypothetical protein
MVCGSSSHLVFVLLATLALWAGGVVAGGGDEEAAIEASRRWLALVDAGQYAESWTEAAEIFRGAVRKDRWVEQVAAGRKPLGEVGERRLKSATYRTALPGAPDGEYVVIQYATSFTGKKSALEVITPTREKDGRWRVSGYFIK